MQRDRGGSMKVSKLLFTSFRKGTRPAELNCFSLLDLLPTPPEQQSKQMTLLLSRNSNSFIISLALVELCHLLLVHLIHQLDPGIRK